MKKLKEIKKGVSAAKADKAVKMGRDMNSNKKRPMGDKRTGAQWLGQSHDWLGQAHQEMGHEGAHKMDAEDNQD